VTIGADAQLPNYPPTQQQVDQAKLPEDANRIADILIKNGANPADINNCMGAMGVTTADLGLPYTAATTPAQTTLTPGGTGITTELPASTSQ
jgi:hypothetical protein